MNILQSLSEKFRNHVQDNEKELPNSAMSFLRTDVCKKAVTGLLLMSVSTGIFANTAQQFENSDIQSALNLTEVAAQQAYANTKTDKISISDKMLEAYSEPGVQSGIVIKHPEHLKEINMDNYEHIIKNGISGVYAHPFIKGEIATLLFDNDPSEDPVYNIRNDFRKLGLDDHGFMKEYRNLKLGRMIDIATYRESHSTHMQVDHDTYTDANLSSILTPKVLNEKTLFDTYSVTMHEFIHSAESGQVKGFIKMPAFQYGQYSNTEMAAFTGQTLATYQVAQHIGHPEYFEEFYENDSMWGAAEQLKQNSNGTHTYVVPSKLLDTMIENNHAEIMKLSSYEILSVAETVAENALTYDFTDSYANFKSQDFSQKAESLVNYLNGSDFVNDDGVRNQYKMDLFKHKYQAKMDEMDKGSPIYESAKITLGFIDYVEGKGVSDGLIDKSELVEYGKKMALDELGGKALTVENKKMNHLIATMDRSSFDGFISDMKANKVVSSAFPSFKVVAEYTGESNTELTNKYDLPTRGEKAEVKYEVKVPQRSVDRDSELSI